MFDETLKSKVNREVGRLNGELCDLKEQEESLRIRRARLEVELRQALAMRDMFELLGRLEPATVTNVAVETPTGSETTSPSASDRQKRKPVGLPTMAEMVLAVLEREANLTEGMRPRDIAQAVRGTWWPDAPPAEVGATAWRLAGQGRLERSGGRYKLNGHA